jgi:hypothetical protein
MKEFANHNWVTFAHLVSNFAEVSQNLLSKEFHVGMKKIKDAGISVPQAKDTDFQNFGLENETRKSTL